MIQMRVVRSFLKNYQANVCNFLPNTTDAPQCQQKFLQRCEIYLIGKITNQKDSSYKLIKLLILDTQLFKI